jgi:two-component system NtrC family response regulator
MTTILIVDDDAAMRDSLAETISDLGHVAVAKPSGQAALDHLRSNTVEAVLLDLRMPGLDGIEVLRQIQSGAKPPPRDRVDRICNGSQHHRSHASRRLRSPD